MRMNSVGVLVSLLHKFTHALKVLSPGQEVPMNQEQGKLRDDLRGNGVDEERDSMLPHTTGPIAEF